MGCRQASLGTPVPRMLTVDPGPKVCSGLASRRSQGSSSERRGPQNPAASVDVWRLIGRGRLRFPTLPRQLLDLTKGCHRQHLPSLLLPRFAPDPLSYSSPPLPTYLFQSHPASAIHGAAQGQDFLRINLV